MNNDGRFIGTPGHDIAEVVRRLGRQYLAGNLQRPQELPFVKDVQVEIGITHYEGTANELPHWHTRQREYQYMLAGSTRYRNVITGETYEYRAGDFYAILPEVCYSQESQPGTTILFIKHPAINDKIVCRNCRRENCPARLEPFSQEKAVP